MNTEQMEDVDLVTSNIDNAGIFNTSSNDIKSSSLSPDSLDTDKNKVPNSSIFIQRAGKSLQWDNISMAVKNKRNGPENVTKTILDNVSGKVPAKQISAIMGPSGSGKTSLLKILTGRTGGGNSSSTFEINGEVRLNNLIVDPAGINIRRQIAYVEQEISIPQTSTPREAIKFSARLRLDRSVTDEEIDTFANEILSELGLEGCADTLVGGGVLMRGGLSGGEKKRTSVGVELVVRPSIIILDEPTSGLDSFSAEQLVTILKRIALVGSSVLLTIHQPSPAVLRRIDHLMLLFEGKVMYKGPVGNIEDYFTQRGYSKPADYHAVDWMMLVAQSTATGELVDAGFFAEDLNSEDDTGMKEDEESRDESVEEKVTVSRVGLRTEISLLFMREMKHLIRERASLMARIGITGCFGLFFGLIYLNIGEKDLSDPLNLQAEFGAITNLLISTMFGVAQAAMLELPKDRPVFLREYSTNHYSVFPYFISRLSVEATVTFVQVLVQLLLSFFLMKLRMQFMIFLFISYILALASTSIGVLIGSYIEDPKVASEFMPVLIVPQLLFSGFFISTSIIPTFLRWAQYMCSLTYAIRLSLYYEFGDCNTDICVSLLESNGVYEFDTAWYWIILCLLFAAMRIMAMIILRNKATFH